jgi:hypothetical protein
MEWILVMVIRHKIFYEKKKGEFIIYIVLYVIACNDHIKTEFNS